MSYAVCNACRSCGSADLRVVLDLGHQPLANAYPLIGDTSAEQTYPLGVVRCGACALVQLAGSVDPGEMFDDYLYFSSYSDGMTQSAGDLVDDLVGRRALTSNDLVVEVASNDGYLLKHYQAHGIPVLGVEPASNVAAAAVAAGVPTLTAYFTNELAKQLVLEHGTAAVVHANNVLAHVPDINDFVAGLAQLVAPNGVVIIETPWVVDFIANCEFDTVYHEHVFYYSLLALEGLLQRHGLRVVNVEHLELHGGSLRIVLSTGTAPADASVEEFRRKEQDLGVLGDAYYEGFADRVATARTDTIALLTEFKRAGARVVGYGAAAKGTVLLNHFGIGPDVLEYVVDRNVHKHGRRMPGVGIPVFPTDRLVDDQPALVLLLAWNFADEILQQQAEFRAKGGKFLVPVPRPHVL